MHYNEATPKDCEFFLGGFFLGFYECTSVDADSLVSTSLVFLAVENKSSGHM
jgi:hypothetical protein